MLCFFSDKEEEEKDSYVIPVISDIISVLDTNKSECINTDEIGKNQTGKTLYSYLLVKYL